MRYCPLPAKKRYRLEDRTLDTEHLLMGVIRQGDNTALSSFINADIDLNKLWQEAESASLLRSRSRTKSDFKLPLSVSPARSSIGPVGKPGLCKAPG